MLETLLDLDEKLLVAINSWHTPWLDTLMFALTNGVYWLPLFLMVIGFIIYRYKWQAVTILLLLGLVILLADQISSGLLKPWVARLRPSHNPTLEGTLHLVNGYKGGLYGFVSSHAANALGVASFLFLTVRKRINWIWIMFVWAAIFTYTRLYLGVHYPLDILGGGLLGALCGWLVYSGQLLLPDKIRIKE